MLVLVGPSPSAAVVGGDPAAPPEPDAAVVFTQRHGRSARIEGIKNDALGYYSFFGIRSLYFVTSPGIWRKFDNACLVNIVRFSKRMIENLPFPVGFIGL